MFTTNAKRCFSFLLALLMVISLVPSPAYATETHDHEHDHAETDATQSDQGTWDGTVTDLTPDPTTDPVTEPTEAPTTEPTEEITEPVTEPVISAVYSVQIQIDNFLRTYLGSVNKTQEEIQQIVSQMDDATIQQAKDDLDALVADASEKLTEDELQSISDNNPVLCDFGDALYPAPVADDVLATSGSFYVAGTNDQIHISWTSSYDGSSTASDDGSGTVTVVAQSASSLFGGKGGATVTVTISNKSAGSAIISFTAALSGRYDSCSISAGTITTESLAPNGTYTITLKGKSTGLVDDGKLTLSGFTLTPVVETYDIGVTYDSSLGSVTADGAVVANGGIINTSGTTLVAQPNSGNVFVGWIDGNGAILSTNSSWPVAPTEDISVHAVFTNASKNAWFRVGTKYLFNDLNAAASHSEAASLKVILAADGVLPAGTYTIPSGVTLLIPFDSADTCYTTEPANTGDYVTPTAYRTLTLADGANLVVNGALSLSAKHRYATGSAPHYCAPTGAVSFVQMQGSSNITVNSGGALYAYGYITGSGTVTANSGATVYELFQFTDFRGGSQSTDMENGVFPLSQYYVQNIEVPMTIYAGATEYSYTTIYMSGIPFSSSVAFIGNSGCMFNLTDGYVVKYYDGSTDRLMVDAYCDLTVSPIEMQVSISSIDSADYDLGINGNITVEVHSGSITLTQDVALLPGAKVIINQGTTCTLGSGVNFYIYDTAEWGNYCGSTDLTMIEVPYAPSKNHTRTIENMGDASIVINGGYVDVSAGYIYTTASGAAITGTEGAAINVTPGSETIHYQLLQLQDTYAEIPITPAKLQNADGTYVSTAEGGKGTYTYSHGVWHTPTCGAVYTGVTVEPTCTADGSTTYTCGCGHSYTETLTALGHTAGTAATCTTAQTCIRCDYVFEAAKGHSDSPKEIAGQAATCQNTGYKAYYQCGDCGAYFEDSACTVAITDLTAWKAEGGNGHLAVTACTPGEPVEIEDGRVAATCIAEGSHVEVTYCSVCKKELGRETVTDPKVDHTYTSSVEKEATCAVAGVMRYNCTTAGCTETYTAEIPATGQHTSDGVTPDCVTPESCSVCHAVITPAKGHTPGEAVIENRNEEAKTYESVVYCTVCNHEISRTLVTESGESHTIVNLPAVEPTCTEPGKTAGAYCSDEGCDYVVEQEVIPALGHTLEGNTVTYTWNGDYTVCTASGNCQRCGEAYSIDSTEVTKTETAATCTADGKITYTATFAESYLGTEGVYTTEVKGSDKLNHAWGEASYTWSADLSSCTATMICANDTTHVRTETVTVLSHATAPTCETAGYTTYTATFSQTWFAEQEKEVAGEAATGHSWKIVSTTWGTDDAGNVTCSVTLECQNNANHTNTAQAVQIDVAEVAATCTTAGSVTYTASFDESLNVGTAVDTKTSSALGHAWASPSYTWSDDDSTCTARRTCSRGCGEYEEETVNSTFTTTADCTTAGTITYSADFEHEAFQSQTKTLDKAALGHTMTLVEAVKATCQKSGNNAYYVCSACSRAYKDADGNESTTVAAETIGVQGHSYTSYESDGNATCTADGTKTANCDYGCGNTSVVTDTGSKLEHVYTVYQYNDDATCQKDGTETASCDYGCGNTDTRTVEDTQLEHNYITEVTVPPTCTEVGVQITTCPNGCGFSNSTDIPAGHSYESTVTAPTCIEQGYTTHTCPNCDEDTTGHSYRDNYVAATGHSYGEEGVVTTEPTCTEAGVKTFTCTVCPEGTEGHTRTEAVDATGHSYGSAVTAPTCTEQGYTTYTCPNCDEDTTGHSYQDNYVAATGHSYGEEGAVTTDPTCTEAGVKTFTCTVCPEGTEGHTKTEAVDATGHSYESAVTAPTCTEQGYTTHTCTVCDDQTDGHSYKDNYVEATGHGYVPTVINPTCTEDGYTTYTCSKCGDTYTDDTVAALGHKDGNYDHACDNGCDVYQGKHEDTDRNHTCDYGCSESIGDHVDVDTDNDHLCEYCAQQIGDHVYTDGVCNCGYIQDLNVSLVVRASGANDVVVPQNTIKYGSTFTQTLDFSGFGDCFFMSSVSATVNGETVNYSYTTDNVLTIDGEYVTGDIEIIVTAIQRHTIGAAETKNYVEPTCTEEGKVEVAIYCADCNTIITTTTSSIPATGHDHVESYVDPTFDADGYWSYTCIDCGDTYTVTDEGTQLIAVARIGENRYETLEEAIGAADEGDTIVLLQQVAVEDQQTWDLGGITLQIADVADGYGLVVRGELTIEGGTFVANGFYGIGVTATGKLTVNGGSFCVTADNDYLIGSWGTTVINGGTFAGQYNCVNGFEGTVTVSGGVFTTAAFDCTGAYESEDVMGNVTVTGGTYSKDASAYLADGYCQKAEGNAYVVGQHVGGEVVYEKEVAPTCTVDGSHDEVTYCTHCGGQISRNTVVDKAPGHKEVVDAAVAATCTTTGLTEGKHCSVCNEVLVAQEETPALEHNYEGSVTKAATCTEAGVMTYTCKNDSNHTYTEPLSVLNHDYQAVVTEPTCEEQGYTTHTCSRCGDSYVDTYVNAKGHAYESTVTKAATCESAGIRTYTCQNDTSHTYTEEIAATGHDWIPTYDWNDDHTGCTAAATCVNNSNHKVTGTAVVTLRVDQAATCEADGAGTYVATFTNEVFETQEHQITLEKLGHSYTNYTSNNDATCTADGTKTASCNNGCGNTDTVTDTGSALGHTMTLIGAKAATCTTDGNNAYYTCGVCGNAFKDAEGNEPTTVGAEKLPQTGHSYDAVVTAPTCNGRGYTTHTCSNGCGSSYVDSYVDPTGHSYDNGVVTTAPTCTATGVKTYTCGACAEGTSGHTKTETVAALGHTEVTDAYVAATCTTTGLTEGKHCSVCGEVIVAQTEIPAKGHNANPTAVRGLTPTCTVAGYKACYQCPDCQAYFEDSACQTAITDLSVWQTTGAGYLPAAGHTSGDAVVENTVAPTCTVDGSHDEVVYCTVCRAEVSREQVTDAATGHTETEIPAKAPTCTATGLTAGVKCSVCGEILTAQQNVDALGHTEVTDAAVEATCTTTGLTEGKHCSVCGVVTVVQTTVEMKPHALTIASVTAATCTQNGSQLLKCSNCNFETTEVLEATGHTEVDVPAKEPTCTASGLTAGVKCSVCGEVLTAQEEIAPKGHSYVSVVTDPTCTTQGYTTHTCSVCGDVKVDSYVSKSAHTEVIDAAVTPTCTATGLTEGKHCSVCGEVLVAQQEVPVVAHTEVIDAAVAPTCTATGLTEGSHCSVCSEVLVAQEVVPATGHNYVTVPGKAPTCTETGLTDGVRCSVCKDWQTEQQEIPMVEHTWGTGRVTTAATCLTDGERTYTCSVCKGTKTEVIAALGHDLVYHEAKLPTYTSVGWNAYEECQREGCGYTTYEEIPMLEMDEISDFDTFLENLKILENLAASYVKENPGKDPLMLVIKYIRTGVDRYNSGSWNIMAGYEDKGFAEYVAKYEETYNQSAESVDDMIVVTSLKNINNFRLPNGDMADIGHMFGTMDISYTNSSSVNHADVAGWAGDLADLLSLTDQYGVTGTVEEMVEEITADYFLRDTFPVKPIEGTFSETDLLGDLDGYYVMQQLYAQDYANGLLANIIESYMTEDLTTEDRAAYFLKNRLGGVSSITAIRDAVYTSYMSNQVVATLEGTRTYTSENLSDLRRACCYTFADYLCKLAGDYVEAGDHDYFSVFSTEVSTLAPGITQEIKLAETADNKQIRYYIATADLTSEYVHVYANYKDNDPSLGWGMSRVRDQANAAQARHSDPNSEHYIENYNVIAAINGAGYDMSTGEPGGLLVMGGVEYHEPNGNGFFGILDDGTAVIGTTEEYYGIYAGRVMEGIAGFGTVLIKDGEIVVSHSDSYTSNRASRTAVGITKTGKVVFMVLDGRQEPVSCGGSMQEIAQIMQEAGCIHAINLDGGGSTTYVAKQEGEDELSLVSSPSDGFERSVATSLIMVSTAPSSTAFDHAVLEAKPAYLTVGSSVQITATGVSPMGNAAEIPEGTTWAVADESIGTITADGLFTAVSNGNVDVYLMLDGQIVGTITMHVVIPDALYFSKENLDAVYGEAVTLPIVALYEGKQVAINDGDVAFTLSNPEAGVVNGNVFTGDEASGIKTVTVTAALVLDPSITANATIVLYKQGEASFDFDQATGGDRTLAWDRQVSNSTTDDEITYMVETVGEDMVTSYIFAIDMTQIPIPEELEDLTYMLPGADMENASAWNFLLQLAERVSVLTEVTPVIRFDPNMEVDYSNLTIVNEYFQLQENGVEFDEETNTLTMHLNWIDQTQAIDPATANPLCILSGIKLTPKDDAAWDAKSRLAVVNSGEISYSIYLRANALYTFAQNEENQKTYHLYPFVNPNDESEKGAYYASVYTEFEDTYTLVNALKNGWVYEDGGYAYYVDGEKYTGIQKVEGYYYDFGENGINIGQEKYTGLFEMDGKTYYAKDGVLVTGWITLNGEKYCFDENGAGYHGTVVVDEVELLFENGKLVGGHTGFVKKSDGKTYHYVDGQQTFGWYWDGTYWYHFDATTGVMITGTKVQPDAETKSKGAYYDFDDEGRLLRAYFNPSGYYYWAGLPKTDSWVKNGWDPDPEAWYRTNGNGHYVTDPFSDEPTVRIAIDGVVYTFDNTNGKLLKGDVVNDNGTLYYYWAGEPRTDGWYTTIDGDTYYSYPDGHLARGKVQIDGTWYLFSNAGVLISETTPDEPAPEEPPVEEPEKVVTVPMYRLYNPNTGEHFYTGSIEERDNLVELGWNYEGVAWNAPVYVGDPVYRVYNPISGDHHYTMSAEERDWLVSLGWNYEGVAWNSATPSDVPQFRMYNPNASIGSHHYTSSIEERENLVAEGWIYEGIGWFGTLK